MNTKTLDMAKQPENDKQGGYADCEPENNQEEKKEKEDDVSDPSEATPGNRGVLKVEFLYSVLMYLGLASALIGVSVNQNDGVLKFDYLISPGSSVEQSTNLSLFLCNQSSPLLTWLALFCPSSTLLLPPGQMGQQL